MKMRLGLLTLRSPATVSCCVETKFPLREPDSVFRGKQMLVGRILFEAPVDQIARVESDAQEICGHEAELRGANAYHADDGAVYCANDPALPEFLPEQDCSENGKYAGHVVQSDGVDKVGHLRVQTLPLLVPAK